MYKIIIFEDEPVALRRLKRLITELRPQWEVIASHDRIEGASDLIKKCHCDLILADIQLSDGNSFKIFSKLNFDIPIIFITAFDQYAIEAFEFNSIHYVLKPIQLEKLNQAFCKFEENTLKNPQNVSETSESENISSKKLVSKVANKTILINHEDIILIYYKNRTTKVLLRNKKEYLLDLTMENLDGILPENEFFRINRQFIVNRNIITEIRKVSGNRVKLITNPQLDQELVVSKEKTPLFKSWIQIT